MAETLFGLIGSLNADIAIVVLIGLIIFLILFDLALEICEEYAADAGYEDLLQKLYKEMMMMGFLSFGLFIAFNAFGVKHDEKYLAFEFAHITTFFIAIFFVIRACGLVQYSKLAKRIFWKAHNQTASKLFHKYTEMKRRPFSCQAIVYKYLRFLSPLRRNIEYMVLEDFFYKRYKLVESEFRFVDYLSKSFKFYTIELTDIEPLSWFFVIVLIVLNYMRVALVGDWHIHDWCDTSDHDDHHDDHHDDDVRRLSGGDDVSYQVNHTCEEYLIAYALFCAAMLIAFSSSLLCFTSYYKTKLLERAGLKDSGDIAAKLYSMASWEDEDLKSVEDLTTGPNKSTSCCISSCLSKLATLNPPKGTSVELGATSLPTVVTARESPRDNFRNKAARRHNLKLQRRSSSQLFDPDAAFDPTASAYTLDRSQVENFYVCTLRVALETIKETHEKEEKRKLQFLVHYFTRALCICLWPCGGLRNRGTRVPEKNHDLQLRLNQFKRESYAVRRKSMYGMSRMSIDLSTPSTGGSGTYPTPEKLPTSAPNLLGGTEDILSEEEDDEFYLQHPLVAEMDDIFFFGSRYVYKFSIHMSLMLDSFYLAIWVTNLIYIAQHTPHPVIYNLILIFPVVLMLLLISYNLIVSSVVLSVTSLRNKGSEWICEQDDIKRKVLPVLRAEISKLFPDINQDGTIEKLYACIDDDGDNGINKAEFSSFLHTLDIHPPEKEIRALFRAMDSDGSGVIELDELRALLLSPDKTNPVLHDSNHTKSMSSSSAPLFTHHRAAVDVMDPHRESLSELLPDEASPTASASVANSDKTRDTSPDSEPRKPSLAERIGFEKLPSVRVVHKGNGEEGVNEDF